MDSIDTKPDKGEKEFHPLVKKPEAPAAMVGVLGASFGTAAMVNAGIIGATTGMFLQLGVSITATLAMRALVKPPNRKFDESTGQAQFQNAQNQPRPYQPCQHVFGKMRIYPPLAAQSYSETVGTETWARMLFHIGQGEYDVSIPDIKSGDTLLTRILSDYDNDVQIASGHISDSSVQEIYPSGVSSDTSLPIEVTYASGGVIRTTENNTTEISVDVGCPNGLYGIRDDGDYRRGWLFYKVEYRTSDPVGSWVQFPGQSYEKTLFGPLDNALSTDIRFMRNERTQGLISWTHRVTGLTSGRYDVRVRKILDISDVPHYPAHYSVLMDDMYWMAFRSVNTGAEAVSDTDAYLLAMRVKISGNFNGPIDAVNCIAERKCAKWTGSAWTSATKTTNAAWAYASVLRDYVADSKIDGDGIAAWAANCAINGFEFNAVVDRETTAKRLLEDIAAVGRASRAIVDGQHTVVEDVSQSSNVQHFSPRNTWGFSGHRDFPDYPHALKCRFINADSDYQMDEIAVYDDGYDESTATDFEVIDFFGVTNSDQIWKLGRYYLAVARLRSETFEFSVDSENLRCTRGDRVGLTYDIMQTGLGQARISEINGNAVRMDDTITMSGGTDYAAIIRKADFTFLSTSIVNDPGEQSVIVLASVAGIAVGDLIFFGESGSITQDCIVSSIEYGNNHSAKMTLTNYDESIYTADSGTIPVYTPVISHEVDIIRRPPNVIISGVTIGYWPVIPNDLLQRQLYATISFYLDTSTDVQTAFFQTQVRDSDSDADAWDHVSYVPSDQRQAKIPVIEDATYDFRVRAVSLYGHTGDWATFEDYTISYAGWTPNAIEALRLVGGGTVWSGLDCAVAWDAPADSWRVERVEVAVLRTDLTQVLRVDYVDPGQNTYVYTYGMNEEDTGGNPAGSLTFKVTAQSPDGSSGTTNEKAFTHIAPTAPAGLTYKSQSGGVEFFWDENRQPAFSHFEISVSVGTDFDW